MRLAFSKNDLRFLLIFFVKQKLFFGLLLFSPLPNIEKCQSHFTPKQTDD
jgi:hypothetical protein